MTAAAETSTERFEHRPRKFVCVLPGGRYVFVGIKTRAEFDRIDQPVHDHGENEDGHVLTKTVENERVSVVFQYWVKSPTFSAIALRERAKAAE